MTVLKQVVALLGQVVGAAESAMTAAVGQTPRDPPAHIGFHACACFGDNADPLMAEDRRCRLLAAAIDCVDVRSAQCSQRQLYQSLSGARCWQREFLTPEGLARSVEDLGDCSQGRASPGSEDLLVNIGRNHVVYI